MLITTTLNNISVIQNAADIQFCDMGCVLYAFMSYCVILGVFYMSMAIVCMYDVVYLTRFHTHDSRIMHVQPAISHTRVGDNERTSNSVRSIIATLMGVYAHGALCIQESKRIAYPQPPHKVTPIKTGV